MVKYINKGIKKREFTWIRSPKFIGLLSFLIIVGIAIPTTIGVLSKSTDSQSHASNPCAQQGGGTGWCIASSQCADGCNDGTYSCGTPFDCGANARCCYVHQHPTPTPIPAPKAAGLPIVDEVNASCDGNHITFNVVSGPPYNNSHYQIVYWAGNSNYGSHDGYISDGSKVTVDMRSCSNGSCCSGGTCLGKAVGVKIRSLPNGSYRYECSHNISKATCGGTYSCGAAD